MLSMMDKLWHPDLGEQEALELMKKGVDEVKKRLVVAPPDYQIKVGSRRSPAVHLACSSCCCALAGVSVGSTIC